MMARALHLLVALLALIGVVSAQAGEAFERGVEAYRRGDHAEADASWRLCLEHELADADRARVAFDLGNAAWRRGVPLEAIGWYQITLQLEPRHPDAWHNLELTRAAAGLEPADRGDLRSTLARLLGAVEPAERRGLVLLALLPLALALGLEAFRGGRLWRRASFLCALVVVVASVPWIHGRRAGPVDPALVVRTPSVALRAEPRHALAPIGELRPGEEVERLDALPGWARVETAAGERGWVQADALFLLRPGAARSPGQ